MIGRIHHNAEDIFTYYSTLAKEKSLPTLDDLLRQAEALVGHVEFCVCICVHAFAFSRMRLSRLRERDTDALVGRLVHLGLQAPVKLFY